MEDATEEGVRQDEICVTLSVMAGLVPAIHVFGRGGKNVDARDKPGHDDGVTNEQEIAIARR